MGIKKQWTVHDHAQAEGRSRWLAGFSPEQNGLRQRGQARFWPNTEKQTAQCSSSGKSSSTYTYAGAMMLLFFFFSFFPLARRQPLPPLACLSQPRAACWLTAAAGMVTVQASGCTTAPCVCVLV